MHPSLDWCGLAPLLAGLAIAICSRSWEPIVPQTVTLWDWRLQAIPDAALRRLETPINTDFVVPETGYSVNIVLSDLARLGTECCICMLKAGCYMCLSVRAFG